MIFFKATSDISFSENYLIACNVQDVFLQENNNINNNALLSSRGTRSRLASGSKNDPLPTAK